MSFKVQFSHIAEIIMGQSPKGEEVNNEGKGLPLLNGPTEFTDRYPLPVQHTVFVKKTSLPRDILFCVRGSTTGKMNYSDQKYCIGRGLAAIRGRNGYPTPYVRAVLEASLPELLAAATGSTFPNVSKDLINNISVDVLSVDDAYRISKFIESQEGKVFNNNQINKTLEQMAQVLFKSWFVDFEPVKAKIATLEAGGSQEDATLAAMTAISGKDADALMAFDREHPEQYAELKSTAELFPSAMQNSELGEIPEGWCHGPLSDIATFANGKVDVCSLTPEMYISTENMLENRAGISTASSLPSVNSVPEFRCGHVLISNIRPYFKKIWLARFKGGRSADVLAFEARDSVNVEYVYNLLYQEVFFNFMMLTSKGVKMPRGDKKAIMDWQCVHPDKKISNAFSKAVGEYYSFIEINNAQNKTLTQLRDTLLPKLLSGEITLPEVEQAIGEVENV
ncbi:TPA: restriction endonuclease subunit S [Serratia marcescens]